VQSRFEGTLGKLRDVFGNQIVRLAAEYGLGIEDDLAAISPQKMKMSRRARLSGERLHVIRCEATSEDVR